MRRLPPLASLRTFEAAARHLSFKRAADELHVSATAVSHQIRQLEEALGVRLFERRTRHILMTEAAQRLYPVLRDGFDSFAAAIETLKASPSRTVVTLTATRALTTHWLLPRVSEFQRQYADIDFRLLATDEPVNLVTGEADLALRYGGSASTGLETQLLLSDQFLPLARPDLNVAEDLSGATLIDYDWSSPGPEQPTWARWFASAGIRKVEPARTLHFNDETHAVLAAIGGQGVALLSQVVAADALSAGALVAVSSSRLPGRSYHLVRRDEPLSPAVEAVRDWLIAEARKM